MIRAEFQRIETLELETPVLLNLSEDQLQIWEIEHRQPTLQPDDAVGDLTASRISNKQWRIADEHIVFQQYLSPPRSSQLPARMYFQIDHREHN